MNSKKITINNASHQLLRDSNKPPFDEVGAFQYSQFYLFSVNTKNENRLQHLKASHKFTDQQIEELDKKEYPKKLSGYKKFTSQDIQKCIEISDIHINNPKENRYGTSELSSQLAWYISLILHPGLITPTSIEHCMQIAYSSKSSSGCISRQVGATITDQNYSIKAVGWNNTPQGQVPCILRNAEHLLNGSDDLAYSEYEKNNPEFRSVFTASYTPEVIARSREIGINPTYCFKDIQNQVDNEKNQVHTRSLHAEENAFLQITKYGGSGIEGGFLFTTASPCELCAKKAYQLGIKKIFYIDPYPGIATSHILKNGHRCPELSLYRGAVGVAFQKLYHPPMPFKDEIETLLKIKKISPKKENLIKRLEQENRELKDKIEFLTNPLKDRRKSSSDRRKSQTNQKPENDRRNGEERRNKPTEN